MIPSHRPTPMAARSNGHGTGSAAGPAQRPRPDLHRPPPRPHRRRHAPDMTLTSDRHGQKERRYPAVQESESATQNSNFYEFALADAVITELAQIRSLVVRPSSIISKYQGKDVDPREAGRELRVGAVLSAGFLRAGDRLRVTAQLLDVATRRHPLERPHRRRGRGHSCRSGQHRPSNSRWSEA